MPRIPTSEIKALHSRLSSPAKNQISLLPSAHSTFSSSRYTYSFTYKFIIYIYYFVIYFFIVCLCLCLSEKKRKDGHLDRLKRLEKSKSALKKVKSRFFSDFLFSPYVRGAFIQECESIHKIRMNKGTEVLEYASIELGLYSLN